ncbi:MAG: 7TMR-DISMED2 domain-containing protein [Endozoicomonas sp.]
MRLRMLKDLVSAFLLWLTFSAFSFGNEQPVVNIVDSSSPTFHDKIEMLRDSDGKLTISEVLSDEAAFSPVKAFPALGYTRDVGWFRFHLSRKPEAPASWVLKLAPSYLDHAFVWLVHEGQIITRKDLGRRDGPGQGYFLPDARRPLSTCLKDKRRSTYVSRVVRLLP